MSAFDQKGEHLKVAAVDAATVAPADSAASDSDVGSVKEAPLLPTKAFMSWLLLNYSTGPTGAMVNSYVPAVLQSMAHDIGHQPGNGRPCVSRGQIQCVVRFGSGTVDYNSYFLYLDAIATACSGIFTIAVCGLADYKNNRKSLMMLCILLFGAFAVPYVGLGHTSYGVLTASSVLYVLINTVQGAYGALEFSYIPLFMRAYMGSADHASTTKVQRYLGRTYEQQDHSSKKLYTGSKVAVLGLVVANLGSITALLIGVIITYSQHIVVSRSWQSFLIAITVGGAMTLVLGTIAGVLLPSVNGREAEALSILTPVRNWSRMVRRIRRYSEPWKLCIAWIIWNTAWSSQVRLIGLLFREVLGIGNSTPVYTVWSFMSVVFSVVGSLSWMFAFPRCRIGIKTWAYVFLGVQLLCIVWGSLGISSRVPIGFKHQPEFWVEQLLFMGTASALRALNRTLYAAIIPKGSEALFYGLQIIIDLATGWIAPLVNGAIQDRTHELRFPMIPNAILALISVGLYVWVDVERGLRQAETDFYADDAGEEAVGSNAAGKKVQQQQQQQ